MTEELTVYQAGELARREEWGVDVEAALEEWHAYQRLTESLLDKSDYQQIGKTKFKKKSAWRKYARAFNITDRVTHEEITRADDAFPIWARIRVQATAPNGRSAEADQEAHIGERCCPTVLGQRCPKGGWKGHYCCPKDCNPRRHWSHPGDLPATALTRAKNRAIADLIGAGEVSAEEMSDRADDGDSPRDEPPARSQGQRRPKPEVVEGEVVDKRDAAFDAAFGEERQHFDLAAWKLLWAGNDLTFADFREELGIPAGASPREELGIPAGASTREVQYACDAWALSNPEAEPQGNPELALVTRVLEQRLPIGEDNDD